MNLDPTFSPATSEDASAPRTLPAGPLAGGYPRDFGDYSLLDEIGRGGMGVVYRARQKRLERVVALKVILAGTFASADQIRRFHAEARAAAALVHPNIVKIFDTGEVGGQQFFAMEYVPGRSLADALQESSLTIPEAARLVRSVAAALDHLHRHGIVHRDVKPANILLDAGGRPYLTDFGLSSTLGEQQRTRSGLIAGTPAYMSPEQAAGNFDCVDARSDIYSLGAVLYELLTGRPPARADSAMETLVQVIEREPAAPRSCNCRIPRDLELICLKCLAKPADQRYSSAADVVQDLDRFQAGEPVDARAPGLVDRARRWARREPALAIRLIGLSMFYAVQLLNYHVFHRITFGWHLRVSAVLAIWTVASIWLQRLLKRERWETVSVFAWGAVDTAAATAILFLADGAASSLVVVYPLLVVASGLWLRVGFVWFMTLGTIASYLLLVFDFYLRRTQLQERIGRGLDRHVYFLLMLLLLGGTVSYLVGRWLALNRFFAPLTQPQRRPRGSHWLPS